MKRIPPEIDSLIWAIAESADHAAIDDFEKRYPDHKYELGKRLAMVRAIRGSKPTGYAPLTSRHFRPTGNVRPAPSRLRWVPATLALGAVAAAAFYGGMRYFAPAPIVQKPVVTQPLETHFDDSERLTVKHDRDNKPPLGNNDVPPINDKPLPPEVVGERRFSTKLEDVGLVDALQAIAMQTGVELQVAPGFENPKITVKYDNLTLAEMLADLGQKYGFTSMKEGSGEYLLIPAVDKNTAPRNDWNNGDGENSGNEVNVRPKGDSVSEKPGGTNYQF